MDVIVLNNATLESFLNINKHIMFHLWKPALRCCWCNKQLLVRPHKRSVLTEQQMKSLYTLNGIARPGHHMVYGTIITQYCLSQIKAKSFITTDKLDITMMITIIRACSPNLFNTLQQHFELIRTQRNELAHCQTNGTMCEADFNSKWNNLEIAILAIMSYIDQSHMRYEKNEINRLKNMNVSNEEISEQLKHIIPEQLKHIIPKVNIFKYYMSIYIYIYHMTMPSLHCLWSLTT